MKPLIHGRFAGGFSWQAHPAELMERSSTALVADGRVWLIDPVRCEGLDEEVAALGKVAAVVMTVGWHDRDVDWFAALHGVPVYAHPRLHVVDVHTPVERVEGFVPNSPLQIVDCSGRRLTSWWTESAIWWPEHGALVTGDCLGTAAYFVQPGQEVAVHPLRRTFPPVALRDLGVARLHPGHGQSVTEDAARQVRVAIDRSRADLLPSWTGSVRALWRHYRRGGGLG